MNRSYSTEIALAVGGVPEAVVLKEIDYWCRRNAKRKGSLHDGRVWTFRSKKEWSDSFPEFNIRGVLARLRNDGWIVVGNYNESTWDHTLWYALSDKAIDLIRQFDLPKTDNRTDVPVQSNKTIKTTRKETIEEVQKNSSEVIDRLYALYPSKSESGDRGVRSTGKCSKDKQRLANLLRTYTPEQIERSIRLYVEETGGRFLKNFSTFLNNMPEYEDDAVQPTFEDELRAKGYQ